MSSVTAPLLLFITFLGLYTVHQLVYNKPPKDCIDVTSMNVDIQVDIEINNGENNVEILNSKASRLFSIDYEKNTFIKDGKPFRYVSGSIHYFRIPKFYWYDRLMKVKAAGLNAIEMYVPWNFHNPEENQYDFTDDRDVEHFLTIANQLNLSVILRPGPYICGEWDFGGFPAWLLRKNPNMVLRSSHADFLNVTKAWFDVLLPKIRPFLYENNGPIIMVQVENEYGSYYTCDIVYMKWLHDLLREHLGNNTVLFTTDGYTSGYLKCGALDKRNLVTVDFGPETGNVTTTFSALRQIQPKGPLVNSEFYVGWIDAWGNNKSITSTERVIKGLTNLLNYRDSNGALVSVNMYMFHGGTSFGFWNGANNPPFLPQTTSYDYDSPITEAGDITPKYLAIRSLMQMLNPDEPILPVPMNTPKGAYDTIMVKQDPDFLANFIKTNYPFKSRFPETMETLYQYSGFMLYQTNTERHAGILDTLQFDRIGDYAYVFTAADGNLKDLKYQGMLNRNDKELTMKLKLNSQLLVLVENGGHVNYGSSIVNDVKGIIGPVKFQNEVLQNWYHYKINLTQPSLPKSTFINNISSTETAGSLYSVKFWFEKHPKDTFLQLTDFNKGVVLLNGRNLGRYWNSKGPQQTLFVPKIYFNRGGNSLEIFELIGTNNNCNVCRIDFHSSPIWSR